MYGIQLKRIVIYTQYQKNNGKIEKEDSHYHRKWIGLFYGSKSYLDRAQAESVTHTVTKVEPVKEGVCYVTTTIQDTVLPINFVIEKDYVLYCP